MTDTNKPCQPPLNHECIQVEKLEKQATTIARLKWTVGGMTTLAVVLAVILGIIFFHPAKIADRAETKVEKLYIQLEDYTKTVSGNFRAFDTRLDETEKDIIELKGKQDTFRVQLQRIADDVKELKEMVKDEAKERQEDRKILLAEIKQLMEQRK